MRPSASAAITDPPPESRASVAPRTSFCSANFSKSRGVSGVMVRPCRAAAMAFTAGLAEQVGRLYSPRNALVLAQLADESVHRELSAADVWTYLATHGVAPRDLDRDATVVRLVSDSADRSGIAQGLVFGVMNGAWAVGNVVGPAAGGALAQSAGDSLSYVVLPRSPQ